MKEGVEGRSVARALQRAYERVIRHVVKFVYHRLRPLRSTHLLQHYCFNACTAHFPSLRRPALPACFAVCSLPKPALSLLRLDPRCCHCCSCPFFLLFRAPSLSPISPSSLLISAFLISFHSSGNPITSAEGIPRYCVLDYSK